MEVILQTVIVVLAISALAGPIGCFLLWRRLGFLAEALCHGAVLGISLSLITNTPIIAGIIVILSVTLIFLRHHSQIRTGIAAYSMLAIGIGLMQLMPALKISPESYLWGDILLCESEDIMILLGLTVFIAVFLYRYHQQIILLVFDQNLAQTEGVNVTWLETACLYALGLVIACSVKITGVLLFPALLVIPAACAQLLARSPTEMVAYASLIAFIAMLVGIALAFIINIATGVAIVTTALLTYITINLFKWIKRCGTEFGRSV